MREREPSEIHVKCAECRGGFGYRRRPPRLLDRPYVHESIFFFFLFIELVGYRRQLNTRNGNPRFRILIVYALII